jgi:polysaccharide biosynthesis protein PslG
MLPTPRSFRRAFLEYRTRYPCVHEFLIWNEANHCSQPTCRRPDIAARYYNALRRNCPGCTIEFPENVWHAARATKSVFAHNR